MIEAEQKMVIELLANPEKLNDWERGFVDSIKKYCWRNPLSDKREKILKRIHDEKLGPPVSEPPEPHSVSPAPVVHPKPDGSPAKDDGIPF